MLREAGLLAVDESTDGEQLDFENSRAWALVDHQFAHVFVADRARTSSALAELFRGCEGIDEVLVGNEREKYDLEHERAGEIVLVSAPNSWQAYYWWLADDRAPKYARTVDIHRKPGYDPVEMHLDMATKSDPAGCHAGQRLARSARARRGPAGRNHRLRKGRARPAG